MDAEFVRQVENSLRKPQVNNVGGQPVLALPDGWTTKDVRHPKPEPVPLVVATLNGLVGYLKSAVDILPDELLCVVLTPCVVKVYGPLDSEFNQRFCYAVAGASLPALTTGTGTYLTQEMFITCLQTLYVDTPKRAELLRFVGNIRGENVRSDQDDGVSQVVSVRKGAALVEAVAAPNPVFLAPYRTFREVPQPESPFILRLRGGTDSPPTLSLSEADGGKWQLDAIANVRDYLVAKVPKGVEVIA